MAELVDGDRHGSSVRSSVRGDHVGSRGTRGGDNRRRGGGSGAERPSQAKSGAPAEAGADAHESAPVDEVPAESAPPAAETDSSVDRPVEASDAGANDEDLGGGERTGGGHHQREHLR